jgi:hypothetical protein
MRTRFDDLQGGLADEEASSMKDTYKIVWGHTYIVIRGHIYSSKRTRFDDLQGGLADEEAVEEAVAVARRR